MHINQAIRDHETHTSISDLYGVSVDSVQRHAARHIGKPAGMRVKSRLGKYLWKYKLEGDVITQYLSRWVCTPQQS